MAGNGLIAFGEHPTDAAESDIRIGGAFFASLADEVGDYVTIADIPVRSGNNGVGF
jgi:hypothetical protein